MDADVIVVGAGLAGLVATCELVERGKKVLVVEQENAANLGGQAFWSFGGLFFVDSPEQRRMGIRDSHELALQDWMGTAAFDRPEDYWPRQWAHAYVDFASGEKRSWLKERGLQIFPLVGWAERGGYGAMGHGNSVPRFHITWGTGPALVEIFARQVRDNARVTFAHRHQVDELIVSDGAVTGVRGTVLEPSSAPRGVTSSRNTFGEFEFHASAVIVTSGGIGGNTDLVRKNWPKRMGRVPRPVADRGARPRRRPDDRHHRGRRRARHQPGPDVALHRGHHQLRPDLAQPRYPHHARGRRRCGWTPPASDCRGRCIPGFDTLGTLEHIARSGHDYTWFILNARIIEKEFGLSGQEQNPDLTARSVRQVLSRVAGRAAAGAGVRRPRGGLRARGFAA